MVHPFHRSIIRQYDIRGTVNDNLTSADALALGRTIGSMVSKAKTNLVIVGHDGRTHSPMLEQELARGLASAGAYVLRLGLSSTPMTYFAEKIFTVAAAIQVTGSHNPPSDNGFKIILNNKPCFGTGLLRIGELSAIGQWQSGDGGILSLDIFTTYVQRILVNHQKIKPMKVAWDAGNGVSGPVIDALINKLPGQHFAINTTVDGNFPNHPADPSKIENMQQLRNLVLNQDCDIGFAFDGDGDRIGVIDDQGEILWGDQYLTLMVPSILKANPKASIIGDVKCSNILFDEIKRLGGSPIMSATGHSIIKSEMTKHKALLAGEMSGHIFFQDQYYGYDDAIYAAMRMLLLLSEGKEKLSELRLAMPKMANTPEIRLEVSDQEKFKVIEQLRTSMKENFNDEAGYSIDETDGVRVTTPQGWWLARSSNTEPAIIIRLEGTSESDLEYLKDNLIHNFKNIDHDIILD